MVILTVKFILSFIADISSLSILLQPAAIFWHIQRNGLQQVPTRIMLARTASAECV